MEKNYNYNFENRSKAKKTTVVSGNLSIYSCTASELKKNPVSNGRFWHTTDTNEFYYDWDGKRTKLSLTGDSDSINAEIAKIKADIAKLDPDVVQQKVDTLEGKVNTAVSTVNSLKTDVDSAVSSANSASQVAQDAAAQVANKVDANYVDNAIAGKADASVVTTLQNTVSDLETSISNKANASDVTALSQAISNKADSSTVETLTQSVTSLSETVSNKADKTDLDVLKGAVDAIQIPTKVSEFENDAKYITRLEIESDLLTSEDRAALDAIKDLGASDVETGKFPVVDLNTPTDPTKADLDGLATVQDVMNYVNALIEKKKGDLAPSGDVKDYLYVNGVKIEDLNNSPTPTSIYQMNQYEINEDILTNGIIVLTNSEANGFYGGDGNIATIYSVVFAVEYPQGYTCKVYREDEFEDSGWALQDMVSNPRYQTKMYGSKTYVCEQRKTISTDDDTYAATGEYSPYSGATDAQVKYKITLNKNQ